MQTSAAQFNQNMIDVAKNVGLVLMTLATTVGMVELPEHHNSKVNVNAQPAFAFATEHSGVDSSAQRRERDESAPHYTSYSAFQRTPGRTGKA
jgi:hypothetical protein